MNLTDHAEARIRQRGIPQEVIELIVAVGTPIKRPGGATEFQIMDKDCDLILKGLRQLCEVTERSRRKGVIVNNDGNVVLTAYPKTKRSRKGMR